MALKHNPVNVGNGITGSVYRSRPKIPPAHWCSRSSWISKGDRRWGSIVHVGCPPSLIYARRSARPFLRTQASGSGSPSRSPLWRDKGPYICCKKAGITCCSVGYSLGSTGTEPLAPWPHVLENRPCGGHGMVSHNFATEDDGLGERRAARPEEAANYTARSATAVCSTRLAPRCLSGEKSTKPHSLWNAERCVACKRLPEIVCVF